MDKINKELMDLAESHGLHLKEDTFVFNESGLDFQVMFAWDYEANEWVLRLPRRPDVFARTKAEKTALELVGRYVSFEVPKWEIYTDKLIAYKKLHGVPAGTIDPDAQAYIWEIDEKNVPECFYRTLGEVLASLHHIPVRQAAEAGMVVQTPAEAKQDMKDRMDAVKKQFGVSEALWNRWQTWLDTEEMWPKKTGVIHGDVHPGHILVDQKGNVTGLIDWTEAKVADISIDFVGHYRVFGEKGLDALIKTYKEADGYYWPKMKEHIMELNAAYPVAIAEFAMGSGVDEYIRMAKKELGVLAI